MHGVPDHMGKAWAEFHQAERRRSEECSWEELECSQRRSGDFGGLFEVVAAVGHADEAGFKLAWGEVHAVVEAVVEEFAEGGEIARFGVLEVVHFLLGEEEAEHAAFSIPAVVEAFFLEHIEHGGFHDLTEVFEQRVAVFLLQLTQLGQTGGKGHGIAAERAGLIHGAERREVIHDVCTSTKGSDGQSATDDLAEAGEVRRDLLQLLHAALGEAETGHDFVENEQCTVFRRDIAKFLQEAGFWQYEARIGWIGLDDDAGDFVAFFVEKLFEGRFVVEWQHAGEFGESFGHASAVGIAVSERSAACGDEETVAMAVIAAVEFHQAITARESACEPDGRHGGFGAAADYAHFLNAGHPLADGAGHFDLVEIGDAETDAVFGGIMDGFDDRNRRMAKNRRAPGADVVDHAAVIHIVNAAALGSFHKERIAADVAKGAHGRVHAAGDVLLGEVEEFGGKRSVGHDLGVERNTRENLSVEQKVAGNRLCRLFSFPSPALCL